jgi:DNA-binding MarR family transcriptional regulator
MSSREGYSIERTAIGAQMNARDESITPATPDELPDVAAILQQLRLAEARLTRGRRQELGLTPTDRAAMRYLLERADTQEVTPTMVARGLHLSPASGTALIDRLVARDMVVVEPHPHDRRKKLIRPVDSTIDPDHLDPLTSRLRSITARLTHHDARVIASFLESVRAAVTETTPPKAPAAVRP